jgi:hypothetical protein
MLEMDFHCIVWMAVHGFKNMSLVPHRKYTQNRLILQRAQKWLLEGVIMAYLTEN